jgi:hypothetical protein
MLVQAKQNQILPAYDNIVQYTPGV